MQTFLPYPSFDESITCLDKRRCWKQVIECDQILSVLLHKTLGWKNHPAVKQWQNYENALKLYRNICLTHCIIFHKISTQKELYTIEYVIFPHWLGNQKYHDSHKSNLLRKDFNFYSKYGWNIQNNLSYFWPSKEDI